LVSRSAEWRAFNAVENEKRNRVGAPRSNAVSDYGLSTKIGTNFNEIKGKISTERKFQLRRMSKWQGRITNSKNIKNLVCA
jgi:transcription initiation factor TFIIIB Brf1 subunit/transcription initiation factor TFIIB